MKDFDVKQYVAGLTDEELCGEVLHWLVPADITLEEFTKFVIKNKVSGFFANNLTPEKIRVLKSIVEEHAKSPCLVMGDVERGPILAGLDDYSISMMNLGAMNDEALAFEIGKYTARIARAMGIHVAFSPVIDINYNPLNPVTNTRAAGDTPEAVLRGAVSYGRGMRSEGNLAIAPKHFPGDGMDDRNQHFCTTVNSLSKDEWMASYGMLYKQVIADGTEAIMVGHIALPWYDPTQDACGHMPGTLSKPLMTGLLKGELGFDGCIISDAMSMIGTAARVPVDLLSVEFLRAGGDFVLFPEKDDHERILEALHSGYLPRERLIDAAERVVSLKKKVGLFDGREYIASEDDIAETKRVISEALQKSVTLVRNVDNVLPLSLKKGAKVLAVTVSHKPKDYEGDDFPALADALSERGFEVIRMTNPSHYRIEEIIDTLDAVFVCSYIDTTNCSGSTMRLGWNNLMPFWRGYIFKCRNLVFISFGDPYKLTELPFLKTYVNSYIKSGESVRAALRACLGEADFAGESPVQIHVT